MGRKAAKAVRKAGKAVRKAGQAGGKRIHMWVEPAYLEKFQKWRRAKGFDYDSDGMRFAADLAMESDAVIDRREQEFIERLRAAYRKEPERVSEPILSMVDALVGESGSESGKS